MERLTKKSPPETVVLKTNTHSNILTLSGNKQVVIEGEEGMDYLKRLAKASWDRGRDFEFRCKSIRFRKGE